MTACDDCLRRAWLIGALAGHLQRTSRRGAVLGLADGALIEAIGGAERAALVARHAAFDARRAREVVAGRDLTARCPHDGVFPAGLLELGDPPAAVFLGGRASVFDALADECADVPAVAVVGARRCGGEGEEIAGALGAELAAAGVTVVSGLALGVDSAAHHGALRPAWPGPHGSGPTVAVLAGGADVVYPASARGLYARIRAAGCVISELPPGIRPYRWAFPARNRIIAALAGMTVVVQARQRSGSLITADLAMQLGRPVGAVPGSVTQPLAAGTNALLHDGAHVVRDARDVLETVLPGRPLPEPGARAVPELDPLAAAVLDALDGGAAAGGEIVAAGAASAGQVAAALGRLELLGLVRRDGAGRYVRSAASATAVL